MPASGLNTFTITPTTSDVNATVTVNGTAVPSGTASPNIPLVVGSNTITIVVTAQDGATKKTYTLTVTGLPSTNALLANITVSNGTLSPAFASTNNSYTENIPYATSMTVTPTTADPTATITVNGTAIASGNPSGAIALTAGVNTITVISTAQDGVTTQTYTLMVTVVPVSTNAALSNIGLSNGSLKPVFASGTTSYTVAIGSGLASMTVTPVTADPTATMTVNGQAVISGSPSQGLPLVVGPNNINIVVTAQDGVTTKTYTIVATEAKSTNANLLSLKPNSGAISPAFTPTTTIYTETVGYAVSSISVTPTTVVSSATVTVNGAVVASGTASQAIALNVGSNTITTVVTAQSGSTQTYVLTVTRSAALKNAQLSALTLGIGTLSPAFASTTTSYTATVIHGITTDFVTPTTSDVNATVTVNGKAVTSGSASGAIALNVGANTITLVVTAQDGSTKKAYTITVTEAPSTNALLSNIAVSNGSLSPSFSSLTSAYIDNISYAPSITVIPTAADATATITVNGTAVTSGSASGPIALTAGSNTITVISTAQDGATTETYTITVNVPAPSTNAALSNITVSNGALNPVFAGATAGYTVNVGSGLASMTITPTAADPTATIAVNGQAVASGNASQALLLVVGPNTITIVTTAQDGVTQQTYTIVVTEAKSTNDNLLSLKPGRRGYFAGICACHNKL